MTRSHFGSIQRIRENYYRIWWTENGKRCSDYVHGTRDTAEIELARRRLSKTPELITWADFYKLHVQPTYDGLATKTVDDYERTWTVELEPRISDDLVANMTWQRANAVLTSIKAPTVQRRAGALLKKMCNIAVRMGLLAHNPVQAIQYAPHRPRPKRLLDYDDVPAFMAKIEGLKYEPAILLMVGGGLRPEEAFALTWDDITAHEFAGNTYARIRVDKALTVPKSGKELKSTKNTSSERDAILGAPFASRLLSLKKDENAPLVPSGKPYSDKNPEAWYTSPVTVAHNWQQWCERNKMPHVTLENMRSSYATMMGEAMAPDSVVAGNMGHAGNTVKTRHYQRVTLRAKCMAADMLADLLAAVKTD